jgi:hypothetical protein
VSLRTDSGTSATRVSPACVSRNTTTFIQTFSLNKTGGKVTIIPASFFNFIPDKNITLASRKAALKLHPVPTCKLTLELL